jgi:Ni/Fe-hydrogenase subunit HybB-like protein
MVLGMDGWSCWVSSVPALLYLMQLKFGLGITGMSRDVSWGFYIANFTYLVGVAAGGVMVVLPYYLHDYKAYGKITILGEFLAIAAIVMCLLFILVDLGQPMRALNVLLTRRPTACCSTTPSCSTATCFSTWWWAGTCLKPSATGCTTRAGSNR